MQSDGRIVVIVRSSFDAIKPWTSDIVLFHLNTNGSLDTSFGNGGSTYFNLKSPKHRTSWEDPLEHTTYTKRAVVDPNDNIILIGDTAVGSAEAEFFILVILLMEF